MTPLIPALAGALLVAGLIGIVAGLRRTPKPPPAPQRTLVGVPGWLRTVRPRTQILILVGFGVGVLVALLTGWLVVALLVPAAVAGLPVLLSPPPAGSKIDRPGETPSYRPLGKSKSRSFTSTLSAKACRSRSRRPRKTGCDSSRGWAVSAKSCRRPLSACCRAAPSFG